MLTNSHHEAKSPLRELFLLRPDVVFLNHGSFGACPRPVFEQYQRWQRELEAQPVEFLGRRFPALMREAREKLAAYVGAQTDDLVFVPNATTGLNVVARSLPLGPGDEVLATDHEYGALDRTWRFVCGKRGARYVNQPLPLPLRSAEEVVEAVWAGVTPRTRVLFLSHITSPTALILPVAELVRRAREAGLWTVVDGAHAPGQIPLDLEALGADWYAGNCHKWLCSPKGAGFLYARREVQHLIEPLVVSWGWEPERTNLLSLDGSASRFVLENEWQGTRDPSAFLSVPAAIQFQTEHDWPRVRAECHELLREARRRIEGLTGLPGICPDSPEWYAQMAAFPLPACDGAALQRRLYDEYRVEVPIIEWNGRQLVRVSVQGYNTADDIEALVRALENLLPRKSTVWLVETPQMTKKTRKKQKQGQSPKQNLLRAHARRAMPNLPPGTQLRIEPRGEVRMSEVLEAFVEPYLGLASTDNGQRVLLQIASLAWNAAILPADERRALLGRVAETSLPGFQGEAREELQDLLANMIARKLALFDENKRFILGVELTGLEGGYLSVISTAAGCSERD